MLATALTRNRRYDDILDQTTYNWNITYKTRKGS